jgi:hypothetical protein
MKQSKPPSYDSLQRSNPSNEENRAWPRFPSRFRTYCQSLREDDKLLWSVQIKDFSAQGLKILSHRRFEPGTVLRIGLIHKKAGVLLTRTIHITPTPEGDWSIGCTFPQKLNEDEMRPWLQEIE